MNVTRRTSEKMVSIVLLKVPKASVAMSTGINKNVMYHLSINDDSPQEVNV